MEQYPCASLVEKEEEELLHDDGVTSYFEEIERLANILFQS